MRLPLLITGVLCAVSFAPAAAPSTDTADAKAPSWKSLLLLRAELSPAENILNRWRPLFPELFPKNPQVAAALQDLASPLADAPRDAATCAWLTAAQPLLAKLCLHETDRLQYPPINGPETPFPDHQPLHQLAAVRGASLKLAWASGHHEEAIRLALENLALSRTLLLAQEGLVPLISAAGVWQISLDDVYWLARRPELTPSQAAALQAALMRDEHLASEALIRSFRGEFTFFTRVVVERLPQTRNVDLLLSSIGSLGMAQPELPPPGELQLAVPSRDPLDREATLEAAADDVRGWITAFAAQSRHPRDFARQHTKAWLLGYSHEISALTHYATVDAPATPAEIAAVNTEIASVENPVGKLVLIIATSNWDSFSASVFRREAERGALTGLLAWRRLGRPAEWTVLAKAGMLSAPPNDPFSSGLLHCALTPPRIWSDGLNGIDDGGSGNGENTGDPPDLVWPLFFSPPANGK